MSCAQNIDFTLKRLSEELIAKAAALQIYLERGMYKHAEVTIGEMEQVIEEIKKKVKT